jgi:hypothetical protein
LACLLGQRKNLVAAHEFAGLDAGLVAGALRAVGAILTASPGLHAQQGAELDIVLVPILEMDRTGTLDEIEEGGTVDFLQLGDGDGMGEL